MGFDSTTPLRARRNRSGDEQQRPRKSVSRGIDDLKVFGGDASLERGFVPEMIASDAPDL